MKGYCGNCGKLIDETEQFDGICYQCKFYPKTGKIINVHDGIITLRAKEGKNWLKRIQNKKS